MWKDWKRQGIVHAMVIISQKGYNGSIPKNTIMITRECWNQFFGHSLSSAAFFSASWNKFNFKNPSIVNDRKMLANISGFGTGTIDKIINVKSDGFASLEDFQDRTGVKLNRKQKIQIFFE